MTLIGSAEELAAYLAEAQEARRTEVRFELTAELSARLTDRQLTEALMTDLPMAQGVMRRIVRSRGKGTQVSLRLRYRDGIRLAELAAEDPALLTDLEREALDKARGIAAEAMRSSSEEERFASVHAWLCGHVTYVHTEPGRKGYERLVSAVGALLDGQANCQGFADALYLLCRLCGIAAAYRCGRGEKLLHVWNAVRLNGEWREADASKAARIDNWQTNFPPMKKTTTQDAKNVLY